MNCVLMTDIYLIPVAFAPTDHYNLHTLGPFLNML